MHLKPKSYIFLFSLLCLLMLPTPLKAQIEPPPLFGKSFAPDTIVEGGISTLTFIIDNTASVLAASALDFTDNLPAGVVVATPANAATTCTGGTLTAYAGSSTVYFTGFTIAAGASCMVMVDVTSSTAGVYVNTTGDLTSSAGNSGTATDTITVYSPLQFSKSFTHDPVLPGGTVTLEFIITSPGASPASSLSFVDNLGAVLPGLVATGLPIVDVCGAGSILSGTSVLVMTGGTVAAGASCTFSVTLQVPAAAAAGSYLNVTSDLLESNVFVAGPATDNLIIEPPPLFSKTFTPATIGEGGISTLTFTIDNAASALAATALDFTDNLPAGVVVATPANAATTCTGGTLTAASGIGVITYTGGMVAAGATCTVTVDVTSSTIGVLVNTSGDLTSSAGNSGSTSDTLTVNATPLFSKTFAPATIDEGGVSILTFIIDNTSGIVAATNLDFTDNLPAGTVVATPANAATTCTGGTLTAVGGSGVIAYTGGSVAAGATCTVTVDVTGTTAGTHVNTTGDLTSSAGNSGSASDTLTVNALPDSGGDKDRDDDDDDDSPVPPPPAAVSTQRFNCWPWEIIVPALTVPHAGVICQPSLGTPLPAPSTFRYLDHSTEVTITDAAGTPLTQFSPPLKICFRYTATELATLGDDPANFLIQTWRNNAWESLPTTPESDSGSGIAGRVCAPVDHLTLFGLFAGDGNTPAGGVAGVKYLPETGLRSVIFPMGRNLALGGLALVAIALVIVWHIRPKK